MNKDFSIRPATTDDIALINNLANVCFRKTYEQLLSPSQIDFMFDWMYSPENLLKQMTQDSHSYFIALDAGKVCGYLSVRPDKPHIYHLEKIYLLPTVQGKGYGKLLFQKAVDFVISIDKDALALELNVNRYNTKAVEFYKKLGMKKIFEGDFHIGNGYLMTDYIMSFTVPKSFTISKGSQ